jgi:hypothetical protein
MVKYFSVNTFFYKPISIVSLGRPTVRFLANLSNIFIYLPNCIIIVKLIYKTIIAVSIVLILIGIYQFVIVSKPKEDIKDIKIVLWHYGCYGYCPIFNVTIYGNGTEYYYGFEYVAVNGSKEKHISTDNVRSMYDALMKVDFFSLNESYGDCYDLPVYGLSLSHHGKFKYVSIQGGCSPKKYEKLVNRITELSYVDEYVEESR